MTITFTSMRRVWTILCSKKSNPKNVKFWQNNGNENICKTAFKKSNDLFSPHFFYGKWNCPVTGTWFIMLDIQINIFEWLLHFRRKSNQNTGKPKWKGPELEISGAMNPCAKTWNSTSKICVLWSYRLFFLHHFSIKNQTPLAAVTFQIRIN